MTARHVQIAQVLRAQIADGTFPVGSQLPTEAALCDSHKASHNAPGTRLQPASTVAMPTYPLSPSVISQVASNGISNQGCMTSNEPTAVAAPLPPRKP